MSILRNGMVVLLGSLAAVIALPAQAPQPARAVHVKPAFQQPTSQEGRVALVIGNGAYQASPLKNPPNDARAVSGALQRCGFQVQTLVNATLPQMEAALRQFGQRLKSGTVGLFYYAGHGMQVKGSNYLIPVGTNIAAEDEVRFKALDASEVLAKMESAGNALNLMILDACRNDPFGRSWHRGGAGGLAQMDAPTGTYIAFSTAPGKTASDGAGANGLYTQKFLDALNQPGLKVEEVFKRVRVGVRQASGDQQVPWDSSSLTGEFYFRPGGTAEGPAPTPVQPEPAEPPPPPVMMGHLQVAVNAVDTQVYVDGVLKGTASPTSALNLKDLPVGEVQVKAEAQGYEAAHATFQIEPGQWTQATLVLRKPVEKVRTVEGVWILISGNVDNDSVRRIKGFQKSITRKGDNYELKWLDGPYAGETAVYTGTPARIVKVFQDPIYNGSLESSEGAPAPSVLARETAGLTYANNVTYTLFEDGNTLENSQDNVRIFWNDGHYTQYQVLPGFYRLTYRRVQ